MNPNPDLMLTNATRIQAFVRPLDNNSEFGRIELPGGDMDDELEDIVGGRLGLRRKF